jgi:hypothetical protein
MPKKFKQMLSAWQLLSRTGKGAVMVEFMKQGTTIIPEALCKTLKKKCVGPTIQNKRCGMLTSDVMFPHNNAHQHTAATTQALLQHFNWELFDQLPYNPELALRDYHLFTYLKNWFTITALQ